MVYLGVIMPQNDQRMAEIWNACDSTRIDLEAMAGRDCFVGIDLGGVEDPSAVCWLFPPETEGENVKVLVKTYLPSDRIAIHSRQVAAEKEKPVRREDALYTQWRDDGWLTETPGKVLDVAFIIKDIAEMGEKVNVNLYAYDPYAAILMMRAIDEKHGITNTISIQNTPKYFNEVLRRVMELAIRGEICHEGNPVLAWCMQNLTIIKDANGHAKPYKGEKNRANRNDAAIAFLTAWAAWMAENDPWAGASGEDLGKDGSGD